MICTDDPEVAFKDSDYALLVGARPRVPAWSAKTCEANAAIFGVQGKAINAVASRDIKVLVVGNPANTNALITQRNAPDIDPRQFTAMTRLDHNRAKIQLAQKTGSTVNDIRQVTIWGNHSATQYPDLHHASVSGELAMNGLDMEWYGDIFIPAVQQRGAAIIEARGPLPPPQPPTPPWIIWAAGRWVRQPTIGFPWGSFPTDPTASSPDSFTRSPAAAPMVTGRSCKTSNSLHSAGKK